MPTFVLISDTHGRHRRLPPPPPGDVLLLAGDVTRHGRLEELADLDAWLAGLPHREKFLIAGNHDWCFQREPEASRAALTAATYLCDEAATAGGLALYGAPWTPRFLNWAFMLDPGPALDAVWDRVPAGTQVLLTHGPPRGVLDRTVRGELAGCASLARRVAEVRPQLHVFGHIHEAAGQLERDGTLFVNAATDHARDAAVVVELAAEAQG